MVLSVYPIFLINGRIGDIFLRSLALTRQQFFFRIGQFFLAMTFIFIGYHFGIIVVAISIMLSYLTITAIKILYLIKRMSLNANSVMITVMKSYQFCLFIIPLYVICFIFLPHSWSGNIVQAIIFVLAVGMLFIFSPNLVGKQYKQIAHAKVMAFINKSLTKWKR